MMNFKTNWKDNLENDIETFEVIISDLKIYKEKLKGGMLMSGVEIALTIISVLGTISSIMFAILHLEETPILITKTRQRIRHSHF